MLGRRPLVHDRGARTVRIVLAGPTSHPRVDLDALVVNEVVSRTVEPRRRASGTLTASFHGRSREAGVPVP